MRRLRLSVTILIQLVAFATFAQVFGQAKLSVNQTTLEEANQRTAEISTDELKKILASNSESILDVRSAIEYSIAHIPGSVNIYEKELEHVRRVFSDKAARLFFIATVLIAARVNGFQNNW